ncbi:unnamed protein product [Phaedon cochleariae]|uniref:Uncharacterized protein n=1 Tax=Phaedon cochleariae TaxID=80249 RepID=A0A9N9X228_PHACE|nr:unnamed protein product [Phaedon cochleariae]
MENDQKSTQPSGSPSRGNTAHPPTPTSVPLTGPEAPHPGRGDASGPPSQRTVRSSQNSGNTRGHSRTCGSRKRRRHREARELAACTQGPPLSEVRDGTPANRPTTATLVPSTSDESSPGPSRLGTVPSGLPRASVFSRTPAGRAARSLIGTSCAKIGAPGPRAGDRRRPHTSGSGQPKVLFHLVPRSSKRSRRSDSTPPNSGKTLKRSKRTATHHGSKVIPGTSYANATSGPSELQLAIMRAGRPEDEFDQSDVLDFSDAVGDLIAGIQTEVRIPRLQTHSVGGRLVVTAADEFSLAYLRETIGTIRPWKDVELVAVPVQALLRHLRVHIRIPGRRHQSNQETLTALERANKGLSTRWWRVFSRAVENRGLRLTVGVDEEALVFLRTLNLQPYMKAVRAQVTPLDKGGVEGTVPDRPIRTTEESPISNSPLLRDLISTISTDPVAMETTEEAASTPFPGAAGAPTGLADSVDRIDTEEDRVKVVERANTALPGSPQTQSTAKITIESIYLKLPHLTPNDDIKLQLLTRIKADESMMIPFRRWELHELPALTQGSTIEIWSVKTCSALESPRYVIVFFQTKKADNLHEDVTVFDNANIKSIRLALNSDYYPQERMLLDFSKDQYADAHFNYTEFNKSYHNCQQKRSLVDFNEFKTRPMFVIDCSRRHLGMKSSTVDIKLDIEATTGFPPDTKAYCIIVHDQIIEHLPLSEIVRNIT